MDSPIWVVAITATHLFEGTIRVTQRLQDVVNDTSSDFVRLDDVSVVRLGEPDVTLYETAKMSIAKRALVAVLITTEQHEAPSQRVASHSMRSPQRVFITAAGLEIDGSVHLGSRYDDPTEALSLELRHFFAVTDARVLFPAVDEEPVHTPVVLVNRSLLTALALET